MGVRKIIGVVMMILGSVSAIMTANLNLYHPWSTVAFFALAGAGYDLTFD